MKKTLRKHFNLILVFLMAATIAPPQRAAAALENTEDTIYVDHDIIDNIVIDSQKMTYGIEYDVPEFTSSGYGQANVDYNWSGSGAMDGAPGGNASASGKNVLYTNQTNAWVKWQPKAEDIEDGYQYEIWVFNPRRQDQHAFWDETASFDIFADGTNYNVVINQKTITGGASGWYKIGAYRLKGDGSDYIKLTKLNTGEWVCTTADAVKFVKTPPPAADNADLSGLSVSKGKLSPAFDKNTTMYTGTEFEREMTVTATAEDPAAALKINGSPAAGGTPFPLHNQLGGNTITLEVTARDGVTKKTYTITAVIADQIIITPFDQEKVTSSTGWAVSQSVKDYDGASSTRYNNTIPGGWAKFSLAGILPGQYQVSVFRPVYAGAAGGPGMDADPSAAIEIGHNGVVQFVQRSYAQPASGWIDLGIFQFDGAGDEYVKLIRSRVRSLGLRIGSVRLIPASAPIAATDNTLSSVRIAGNRPLSPFFDADTTSYTVNAGVAHTVLVTAFPRNKDAQVTVNGAPVSYGTAVAVPLTGTTTVVTISVDDAAAGENKKTYTLTVSRASQTMAGALYLDYIGEGRQTSEPLGENASNKKLIMDYAVVVPGKTVRMMAALYKKEEQRKVMQAVAATDALAGGGDLQCELLLPDLTGGEYELKVFFWNVHNNAEPLIQSFVYTGGAAAKGE